MIRYNIKRDSYKFNEKNIDSFINIAFVVTSNCNLRCIHCCEPGPNTDLPLKNIKKLIDKLAKEGLKKICVTGGEPLTRIDIVGILKYIHDKGIYVTLATNSLCLDKKKFIAIKPFIDNVRFSLLGKEETHDKIAQHKGSFRKVVESLEIAKELKIPVSANSTVISENYSEMFDVAQFCEDKKIGKLYFFSLMPKGKGKDVYNKKYVSIRKINKSLEEILAVAKKELWNLQIKLIDWNIEGQCILLYQNGDLAGVSSHKDENCKKIVGNLSISSLKSLWEKYPFKKNYISYYKNR